MDRGAIEQELLSLVREFFAARRLHLPAKAARVSWSEGLPRVVLLGLMSAALSSDETVELAQAVQARAKKLMSDAGTQELTAEEFSARMRKGRRDGA